VKDSDSPVVLLMELEEQLLLRHAEKGDSPGVQGLLRLLAADPTPNQLNLNLNLNLNCRCKCS